MGKQQVSYFYTIEWRARPAGSIGDFRKMLLRARSEVDLGFYPENFGFSLRTRHGAHNNQFAVDPRYDRGQGYRSEPNEEALRALLLRIVETHPNLEFLCPEAIRYDGSKP
jgi:hypothetical protein